jgi:hypothetical protein
MTKEQAINELTRAASLCPTTPLAEACRMAVEALGERWERVGRELVHDCMTCRHADRMPGVYPCNQCEQRYSGVPSKWEPKEVDNG